MVELLEHGLHRACEVGKIAYPAALVTDGPDDVHLMFDVYSGWDLTYTLEWAKQVERYRPRWIEEATQAEKIDSFAQLRKGTTIPIAST